MACASEEEAADDFSDPGKKNIHGANGFSIIILPHVKRFYFFRIIAKNYRFLKMFFN